MKYSSNKEVIIATYADGGVVASTIGSDDPNFGFHYICAFESEEYARKFTEKYADGPVFLSSKKVSALAKEFNSGFVWPEMAGIVYIDDEEKVEHIDADDLIKMALKDVVKLKKNYGCSLVVNGQIAKAEDIDFNKKYFIMFNTNGHLVAERTYTKDGKRRDWLVVTTSKALIQEQANKYGIRKYNRDIVKYQLSDLLYCFKPNQGLSSAFAGIMYIDDNGSKMIARKKLMEILKARQNIIDALCVQSEIYFDAKYFIAINKQSESTVMTQRDGLKYVFTSQRMDRMLTALKLADVNTKNLSFINMMTLREIAEGVLENNCDGVALCLDDNPDHIAYLTIDEINDIAIDGDGSGEEFQEEQIYISSDEEYMMTERAVMMSGDAYIIATMQSEDDGEIIDVLFMADDESTLIAGLEQIGYAFGGDRPTKCPTYEIFAEFGYDQLENCDGVLFFDRTGYSFIPRDAIVDVFKDWEASE